MPDEDKNDSPRVMLNIGFFTELLKQGQMFFLLCVFLYGAWVGLPRAWYEVKDFMNENARNYHDMANRQERAVDKFETSIQELVGELRVGNDALKRFAEAEEAENRNRAIDAKEGK